jgi:hypothetical protein
MITNVPCSAPGNYTDKLNFGMIMVFPFKFRNGRIVVNGAKRALFIGDYTFKSDFHLVNHILKPKIIIILI